MNSLLESNVLHKEGWVTSSESKTIKGSNFQDEILLPGQLTDIINKYFLQSMKL